MSRLHSEALLARAVSDAASLSISETTSSDGTTVYGIGATSGRAILAIGAFTLRGIEKGIIVCRLLSIRKRLQSKQEVDIDTVTTLLELQRIKVYPKPITKYAWTLIGVLLKREQVEHFTDVLSCWPPLETQLFLRQLVAYRFSGWDKDPDIRRFMAVTSSVRAIVLSLLDKDPLFLQGIFNASDFATFLIPGVHQGHTVEFPLSSFFQHLCSNYANMEKRVKIITDMVSYLCTEGYAQMLPVVNHIVKMIRAMVSNHQIQSSRARIRHNMSGALPYLSFAFHLVTTSDVASRLFVDREAYEFIEQFCVYGFPNASCSHYQDTVSANVHIRWMAYATCCALLARLYPETSWSTNTDTLYNEVLLELFSPLMPSGDLGKPFHEDTVASGCMNDARTWNFILHSLTFNEYTSFLSSVLRGVPDGLAIRFLRDLGAYKNYGWCRNAGILSALTDYYAFHEEMLDLKLRNLLRDLASDKHGILVEAYGLSGFVKLLIDSDYLKQRRTRNNPSSSLSLFIGYIISLCQPGNYEWDAPDAITPLLELFKHVDGSLTQPVLDRVMDGLRFFTCRQVDTTSLPQLSDEFARLQSDALVHPAYPFLMLTHQLCLVSPSIATRLCKDGLVATLENMWLSKCGQMDRLYTNDGHGAWLRIHVGIVLIISTLSGTLGCEEYILRSPFLHWLLTDDVHIVTLRHYASNEKVQWLILHSVQSMLFYPKDACTGVWRALIGVPFRRDGCSYQKDTSGICLEDHLACLIVALSCLPEYRWKGLLEGMKHSHEGPLRYFLVDSLRFLYALRKSRELRHLLSQKLDEMQTFGILSSLGSMNPVDNFMKLVTTGVLGKHISLQALPVIDISNMLDDISNGQFNLLQRGGRPTALQREAYATTAQALRQELNMFSIIQGKSRNY